MWSETYWLPRDPHSSSALVCRRFTVTLKTYPLDTVMDSGWAQQDTESLDRGRLYCGKDMLLWWQSHRHTFCFDDVVRCKKEEV